MSTDFVVVGGGIGGSVLAGLLARGGKTVLVLERSLTMPDWVRPEVLWPASMETLFSLIARPLWQDAALPLRGIDVRDARGVFPLISERAIDESGVQPWSTQPNLTREKLLGLGNFDVRRGVEVLSVLRENERIVGVRVRDLATNGEADVLAQCTVGDDGTQSAIRKACGIEMATRAFPLEFICFAGRWPAELAASRARIWINPALRSDGMLALLVMPLPNGQCAALVPVLPNVFDASTDTDHAWQRFGATDPMIAQIIGDRRFPAGCMRVRRSWGHAQRYGTDGALLVGDAAHSVSPAGGQGANMAIADALVLADIILSGRPDVLAEYERRRRPANTRGVAPTRAAAAIWQAPGWMVPVWLMAPMMRVVARFPSLAQRFLRSTSVSFKENAH